MHDAVRKIIDRLASYPGVHYDSNEHSITVFPSSDTGFEVTFQVEPEEYTVFLDGWHWHFESEEEALERFAFGLSDACRVVEKSKSGRPYRWTLEYRDGDTWIDGGTTGLLVYKFWKPTTVRYLQNDLIRNDA